MRGMNATGEIDDHSMCSLTLSVFTEAQKTGCLKWPSLQQCLQFLAPRERLQRFAFSDPPNVRVKQKVWFVSDSILDWKKDTEGLSISGAKKKKIRPFPEIWAANSHIWKPQNIEARFSVHGSGKVPDLLKGFMAMLEAEGLTPETLNWFLVFMTTLNDAERWDQ